MSRFAMGIGLGAEIVVGYVTITELVPPASRGKWGAALATITNSAVFVSAFAARLVIPDFGWRPLFVFVGIGALVVWAARKSLPESPRWLESKGRYGEAEAVLCRIEQEVERTTGAPLPAPVERPQAAPARALGLSHLFSRALLLRTITGCLLLIGVNCTLYGFIAFLPSFMVQQGLTVTTSLNYITLMSLGGPAGALLGLALGDRIGRKACLVLFSLAAIVFGLLYPHAVSPLAITGLGFLLVTASYGLAVIAFSSYIPELFPTELRMRGSGLCHTVGRLTLIVTPQIVALLFSIGGVNGVLLFIAGLLAIQVAAILLLGPETKSRSLEALDAGPSLELAGLRAVGLADLPTE